MKELTIKAEGKYKEQILRDKENVHLGGYLSFSTLCEICFTDMILCNNISEIEGCEIFYENLMGINEEKYQMRYKEEHMLEDLEGEDVLENFDFFEEVGDIYQFFLVNKSCWFTDYEDEFLMSYSNLLECDVLCVQHYGTSWRYIPTNVKIIE